MNDRVLVCLSSNPPYAEALLAEGHNLAERLKTDWYVIHVDSPEENPVGNNNLLEAIESAHDMGAEVFRVRSADPVLAILEFAQDHKVGHIVLGRFRQSRWQQLIGKSVMTKLIEKSWNLNVHLPSVESPEE